MLHAIFLIIVLPLIVVSALSAIAVAFGWRRMRAAIETRRDRELAELRVQFGRLQIAVGLLLEKVDELDQEMKYAGREVPARWTKRFSSTCTDLVKLGESIALIEEQLKARDSGATREHLKRALTVAVGLSRNIREIRYSALTTVWKIKDAQVNSDDDSGG